MLNPSIALALGLRAVLAASPAAPAAIPDETPVHLGISLRVAHPEALAALQRAQQDPASPDYKKWITPEEYGERFGQPTDVYEAAVAWVASAGLTVKEFPNHTFLEATGKASQVTKLLGVHLLRVEGKGVAVHVPDVKPKLPAALAPVILNISGLDTRIKFHHHMSETDGYTPAMGPQDLRAQYGLQPILDQGYVCQGEQLVVLSTAEPPGSEASPADIEYFYQNISDARTPFLQYVVPNPQNDVDSEPGGGLEFELDSEMQSVGCPGAASITLLISPASEVFTTGANALVSDFPSATAASVSLGNCESAEESDPSEASTLRQSIQQGAVQGMSFSAASGDSGTDDCGNGSGQAVDFPASIPEVVAAGGSQLNSQTPFDADNAITSYQLEAVWDQVLQGGGGAGGGGVSILYMPAPSYQAGLGLASRGVPDIALIAGLPGAATCSELPGQIDPVEGTSIASPLSAGFLALISSRLGCHTGDPHVALYALGNAQQQDGGLVVFHDITIGNNGLDGVPGYDAGPGYDLASGWGSMNDAALAAAWPGCPIVNDAGEYEADAGTIPSVTGSDGGPAYDQCAFIGCAAADCTTIPEGPSTCSPICDALDAGSCVAGLICTNDVIYSTGTDAGTGACVPGCFNDSDCSPDGGAPVCDACEEVCTAPGNTSAQIGDGCASAGDCPTNSSCTTRRDFDGGYCTQVCIPTGQPGANICGCPAGSNCELYGRSEDATAECLLACNNPGGPCAREGYLCQPLPDGTGACLPPCAYRTFGGGTTPTDTCTEYAGSTLTCDADSGYCGGPAAPDAGPDAGSGTSPDGGSHSGDAGATQDAGLITPTDAGTTTPPASSGCSCAAGPGAPESALAILALVALRKKRRLP